MVLKQRLVQTQQQRLMLIPKMQQALHLLQLPALQLEAYLRLELAENPLLEEEPYEDGREIVEQEAEETQSGEADQRNDFVVEFFDNYLNDGWERQLGEVDRDRFEEDTNRKFLENIPSLLESLTNQLLDQLRLFDLTERQRKIGEWIISEIDERGYFRSSVEQGAQSLGVKKEEVEAVLHIIQKMEPLGIGARDLKECLLIQIKALYPQEELLQVIVGNYLEELGKKQYPKIAQTLNISVESLQNLANLISSLEPCPGRALATPSPSAIVPDVIVKKIDDHYEVIVNEDSFPKLHLNKNYRTLLKSKSTQQEVSNYIREKFESAKWLIQNIQRRRETIYKVSKAIVDLQREFFDKGEAYLKPLTLKRIADEVGLHESTVSRVTTNKFMDTPRGLFELKYFFSSSVDQIGGEGVSSTTIKSIIKELIDKEVKKKPLSDQGLTRTLRSRGVILARRTVAKYRQELGILPSQLRKQY